MERAEIHEVLVRARNELDRRGLSKHRLEASSGEVCVRGALLRADPRNGTHERIFSLTYEPDLMLSNLLEVKMFASMFPIARPWPLHPGDFAVHFNNHPDTTKEDVLALFDRAIAATAPEPEDIQLDVQPEPDLIPA